jgi:hypothetical protein
MDGSNELKLEVDRLVNEKIDSIPHLEALLLLWNTRPKRWTIQEVAERLYVKTDAASRILHDLLRNELISVITSSPIEYGCQSVSEKMACLLGALDKTYREELIRLSTTIHSKASSGVREFARAFRFTKERD